MRKCIFALIFSLLAFNVSAQLVVANREELKSFKKTKTIIYLESNPLLMYNRVIQETVKKHWDLTPYEFRVFSNEDFDTLRMNPNLSFLMINKIFYPKDRTRAQYQFLNVSLGGNYELENQMPTLAGLPFSYVDVEEETYDYKLGLIIMFIEEHIKLCLAHPELKSSRKITKYYRQNLSHIHNKTLYLLKEELAPEVNTLSKIKKYYKYKVKIVSKTEITKVIDSKDPNAVILHQVGPKNSNRKARCWNIVMGANDAKMYYFNYHMISKKKPEGILAKDFVKLNKK